VIEGESTCNYNMGDWSTFRVELIKTSDDINRSSNVDVTRKCRIGI
jgi:hypothetical protein